MIILRSVCFVLAGALLVNEYYWQAAGLFTIGAIMLAVERKMKNPDKKGDKT